VSSQTESVSGTTDTGDEKQTIRIMIWGDTSVYEKINDSIVEKSTSDFFDHYDIEFVLGGSGDNEVAEKIRMALASGESICDISMLNYTQVPEFARAGVLEDLSDIYEGKEDVVTNAAKELSSYNGSTVAVPMLPNGKMFYYREDVMEECGVDPTSWKTVDEMLSDAQKIYDQTGKYILNFDATSGPAACQYDIYMMFTAYDGSYCDEDGNYICSTNQGLRDALTTLKKIYDYGCYYPASDFTSDWLAALADETIVGEFSATWLPMFLPSYAESGTGKWNACLWPEEIRDGSEAGGSVYVIPEFSELKEAAKEYLRLFRLEAEGEMACFEAAGRIPITTDVFDTIEDYQDSYMADGYYATVQESLGDSFTIFNYTPNAVSEMTIMEGWTAKYFEGTATLDECLQGMEDDMTSQIGNAFD
jgi:ABC-type glycerol-3-phosphate transport system substrate-binding protein